MNTNEFELLLSALRNTTTKDHFGNVRNFVFTRTDLPRLFDGINETLIGGGIDFRILQERLTAPFASFTRKPRLMGTSKTTHDRVVKRTLMGIPPFDHGQTNPGMALSRRLATVHNLVDSQMLTLGNSFRLEDLATEYHLPGSKNQLAVLRRAATMAVVTGAFRCQDSMSQSRR